MMKVTALDGQVALTFRKRSMRTFLLSNKIRSELDIENMADDIEQVLASNFAEFMTRTCDVLLVGDDLSNEAKAWVDFWQSASNGVNDYDNLFNRYMDTLDLAHNNAWRDALDAFDNGELARLDPDLASPESLPDDTLRKPDVKKRELAIEKNGESK